MKKIVKTLLLILSIALALVLLFEEEPYQRSYDEGYQKVKSSKSYGP